MKQKKQFLKSYLLQEAQIKCLSEMALLRPNNRAIYLTQIAECERCRDDVEAKINLIEDTLLREILMQKYICGKTLEEISRIISYSKRHTERLHIKALQSLEI